MASTSPLPTGSEKDFLTLDIDFHRPLSPLWLLQQAPAYWLWGFSHFGRKSYGFLPEATTSYLPLAALWATCRGICRSLCACSLGAWWLNRSGGLRWKSRKAITCSSRILCGAAIAPQAAQTKEKATTPLIRPTERCPEQALLSVGAGQIRGFGFIVELPGLLSRTEAMVGCLMTTSLLLSTSPQQKLKA